MQEQKFKVGDKVVRIASCYGEAIKGGVYEVSEVSDKRFLNSYGINLKGHETISSKFTYEASGFELYVEEVIEDILTPLQAADAILHKEFLQEFCEVTGNWHDFHCGLKYITLDMLANTKFRHKPKIMVINGVEVPTPLSKEPESGVINSIKININCGKPVELFFKSYKDAESYRDAMLIPFNELKKSNKGDF